MYEAFIVFVLRGQQKSKKTEQHTVFSALAQEYKYLFSYVSNVAYFYKNKFQVLKKGILIIIMNIFQEHNQPQTQPA